MSESSEEKTNRKLSKFIEDEYFQFEYSIFPDVDSLVSYDNAKEQATTLVLEYSAKIKRLISKNKDYAFLIRWRRNQKIYIYPAIGSCSLDQIYMMIHSPIKLNELIAYCSETNELNCLHRKSNSNHKNRAITKIKAKKNRIGSFSNRTDVNEIITKKIKLYTFVNKDKFKMKM